MMTIMQNMLQHVHIFVPDIGINNHEIVFPHKKQILAPHISNPLYGS